MSPGLLLRLMLFLFPGRGRVDAREVLLLRISRDSREKMSSGSSSSTPFSMLRWDRSGDASLDRLVAGEGEREREREREE